MSPAITIENVKIATMLVALSLTVSACEDSTLGHFDIDEPIPATRIEGSTLPALLPAVLPPITLDVKSSESFQQQEYDYLTSVQLDALSLSITESSTDNSVDGSEDGMADNFDFLASVEIYIQATFDGQLQRALIGSIDDTDPQLMASTPAISFVMTGVDILRYVEAVAGYEIEIQASGETPPDAVIFDGEAWYRVGVGFN